MLLEPRKLDARDLAYGGIAEQWALEIAGYDTARRIEVMVGEFLGAADAIRGRNCLEVGHGLGYFTEALLQRRPASLTALDISPELVARLRSRLGTVSENAGILHVDEADLLDLQPRLGDRQFEVVLSSEVIEHTPDPERAVRQLCARVQPGGVLAISCPNHRWRWLLTLAQNLGMRKLYRGHENWVRPRDLLAWIRACGLEIERAEGVHTVPWQLLPKPILRSVDRVLRRRAFPFALNLAVRARRPASIHEDRVT